MIRRNYRIFSIVIGMSLILACAPVLGSAATPPPAFDPNSINTAIVLTANAAAMQTSWMVPDTLTPTLTAFPTRTQLPTETVTPTFIFILSTPTKPTSTPTVKLSTTQLAGTPGTAGSSKYACQFITQSPPDGKTFAPKSDFDMIWHVKNTGTSMWDVSSADYRFVGGDALHTGPDFYDFTESVDPGTRTDLTVDMRAPKEPGTYSATWKIFVGKTSFCVVTITINVK